MNPLRLLVITFSFLCMTIPHLTFAQDNLRVSYANANTAPDFLNVCGDTDEVTVTIRVNGTSTSARENIEATAHLFSGIQFAGINTASSSAGVAYIPTPGDLNDPVFSIPDLSPFGVTSVDVTFFIIADCNILDTLNQNNALSVFDEWETNYTIDDTPTMEVDATNEYRDALAVPFFTIDIPNSATTGPFRAGDCFDREITISNSGLAGFVDTLEYRVTQGAGASIQTIAVNGIDQTFVKTVDPMTLDTIVTIFIAADEFAQNTSGGGLGNGDGFIDPNETVTITEQLCVSNCVDSRSSNHESSWGCYGRACSTVDITDFVNIGDGAANPEFATSMINPTSNVGYCQPGTAALAITNNGVELNAGFGTMIDVQIGLGLGTTFMLADNGYSITSYNIAGVDVPATTTTIDLNNNPDFTTDPDGPGGLVDFDGDGFFDDLELTETLEVSVAYDVDCGVAQGTADNCVNDFSSFLTARTTYSDACSQGIVRTENGFVRPSNVNSDIEDFSSPDAFALGDVFFVTHTESRSVRLFEKNCGGMEVFRATVILPPGISAVPAETMLFKNQSTVSIPMLSNMVNGDTLILTFDASLDNFINGNYELRLAFQADCDAVIGQSSFPTTFEFVCPPCGCDHLWYCADIAGPFIHKDIPPCPPDPLAVCPVGVRSTGFEVNRTTFGFTDDNYTTKIDPSLANRKVAVTCDSVEMVVSGVVGETPISGSIGFNVDYTNADGTMDAGEIFNFSDGMVRINQGGTDFFCPVTPADLTMMPSGANKNLRFELPNCLSDLGLTLNPGDSIQFVGNFGINPDGPYEVQFKKVPNFRAYAFAVVGGADEFCETFGDIFTVAKTNTLFAFPNSNNFPEGCEETFLNYQVISVFNDFPAFYGNEFYPSIKVDSIKFTFDPEILNSFDVVEPTVSIPGHPTFGNDFFPVAGFETTPSGDYTAYFDTLNIVPSLNEVRSFSFNFRVRLIPNCESLLGSSNGDNTFNFDPEIFYQNRYYAETVSDPSCVEFVNEAVDNDITYTNPPTFSLNPGADPIFTLVGDTATWEVRLCNNSLTSDAGITWIALDNVTGDINIESITDISDPANPQALTFQSYGMGPGNNIFAFSDGVDRALGSTNPEDLCNYYVIKSTVTSCGDLDAIFRTGWACQPYADPMWTPDDYAPCSELTLPLSISTRDPFLDADVEVQPSQNLDICDVNSVTIRLKNTDLGAAFDLTSKFILPTGATLVPGSVEFAYPATDPLAPVAVDPVLQPSTAMGSVYEYATFADLSPTLNMTGLPGDDLNPMTEDSELLIKFDFRTDCDFISGSSLFFNFQALRGCRGPSNLEAGETQPININGTLSGTVKLFDIDVTGGTALVPDAISEIEISVTNLTNEPSSNTGDRISITLPEGVTYVPGTSSAVQPGTWMPGEPTIDNIGGQQILRWPLAGGLLVNDIATLRFSVNTPAQDCSVMTLDGVLVTLSGQDFVCSDDLSVCAGNSVSSTDEAAFYQFPVRQGVLTFEVNSATSVCVGSTTETLTIEGNIVNGNMDFPAGSFDIEYFNDVDGNGSIDGTDLLLGTFSETGPIAAGNSIPFLHSFDADLADICNIILRADVSAITMSNCGESIMPIGAPRLLNAGPDQVICDNAASSSFTLGDNNCSPTNYTYNWTAIAPASTANLSATDVSIPTFSINMADVMDPSYAYILETTRPGCNPTVDTVVINVQVAPTVIAMADTPTACPESDVQLTATGADTYEWFVSGILIGTGATITVTPATDITYTVNAIDVNGCQGTASVTVTLDPSACPCDLAQVTSAINNASSCGETIGSATINIDLNPADYAFNWTPDLGTPQADGETRIDLPFGGYNIDIVSNADANCTTTTFALIENSDGPQANAFTTNATCNAPDGTATLTPLNFTYEWSNDGFVGSSRTDLTSGVYFVTITDSADPTCQNAIAVVIGEDNPLEATATIIDQPDCGVPNGSASIAVTGGSGTYTYTWPDGLMGDTRNDLAGGIYLVTIVDQDVTGCELPFIFIITDDVPQGDVTINEVNDISCFGLVDGGVEYDVVYDPLFTLPADTMISNGTSMFTNGALPAGSYCIQINDGNGCVAGGDCFTIEEPEPLMLQIATEPDCNGNGILAVSATGGTAPYSFDWADLPGVDNSSFRQNLGAGLFNIQINDANGCSNALAGIEVLACPCESVEVTSVLIEEATCGESDGSARVGLVGDPALYSYTWIPDLGNTGTFDNERDSLPAGQYTVVIAGSGNGACVDSVSILVTNLGGLEGSFTSTPASCDAADGTVTLSPATLSYIWPDLGAGTVISEFRDDLPGGTYVVTITDGPDSCEGLIEVTVDIDNPLLADVTVTTQPDCGERNGVVTINPTGLAGPFEFLWPDGDTNATRSDLSSGLYVVTITEVGGSGCELPFLFALTDNVPPATVTINNIDTISCNGQSDGGIDFAINFDPGFTPPADTIISDGFFVYENGTLPTGNYCITIMDGNGCVAGAECFEITEPDAIELFIIVTEDCNAGGSANVRVTGGTSPYTYDWSDLTGTDDDQNRTGLMADTLTLTVTDINGCSVREDEVIIPECSRLDCEFFNGIDSLEFAATDCDGMQELCFEELRLADLNMFDIFVDDIAYTGDKDDCNIRTSPNYQIDITGDPGPFELVSWVYNDSTYTGNFSDIDGLLDIMNAEDTNSFWETSLVSAINIVGGNPDNSYGDIMIRSLSTGVENTVTVDLTLRPLGSYILVDTGFHEVVFVDPIQMCSDTLTVYVNPDMLLCDVVLDTIMPLDTVVFCIDTMDLDNVTGPIVSVIDICEDANGNNVSFEIDSNYCVTYAGITLGIDTACYVLCDAMDNCDTSSFIITVISDPEIVRDTIFPGDMETFCLDISIFEGQNYTITNFCPEDADGQVEFIIDPVTNCIEYFADEIGIDSACIEICDDLGWCDTTYFYIVVDMSDGPPIAIDDVDTTIINTPTVIDFKGNDLLNGSLDTVFLVSDPIYGEASINLDCSLTYDPDDDFCDVTDNFDYVICNELGCDTATISIYIDCEGEIVIFTAVSPNGDGANDFFHIGGIGAYPNNRLCIFNRWGNQVLLKDGYNNEFDGRWENRDLPDGTYFYILELNDPDKRSFKGFFEMYR